MRQNPFLFWEYPVYGIDMLLARLFIALYASVIGAQKSTPFSFRHMPSRAWSRQNNSKIAPSLYIPPKVLFLKRETKAPTPHTEFLHRALIAVAKVVISRGSSQREVNQNQMNTARKQQRSAARPIKTETMMLSNRLRHQSPARLDLVLCM